MRDTHPNVRTPLAQKEDLFVEPIIDYVFLVNG